MSAVGSLLLLDSRAPDAPRWSAVDDVVMGGRSASRMISTSAGDALFQGRVSLAQGGGFASVRAPVEWPDLSGFRGLSLEVKGDGRRYRLRLWMERGMDRVSYQAPFEPPRGEWTEILLPFPLFVPSRRGQPVPDAPALDPARIRQVGLMVADHQEGEFRLELRAIRAKGRAGKG